MKYRLVISASRNVVLDEKIIEASGRRLAINKYLRRFGFVKDYFFITVFEEDIKNTFEVELIKLKNKNVVKIMKVKNR